MYDRIITTKLTVPPVREGFVPRPHLLERLNEGLKRGSRFTLVSSFAGSGKTTLVCWWLKEAKLPTAWVSLDGADNGMNLFWSYIVAALQRVEPGIGSAAQAALSELEEIDPNAVVHSLANELAMLKKPFVLVLDDYHTIENPAIHSSVNLFLERIPPDAHLVILTREDPPFPLSRYRANLCMTEIRYADLRFTSKEAAILLNSTLGLELPDEDVDLLEERTEGWAAGLQMAGISLLSLNSSEKHGFIVGFAGNDRYVFDYLVEIVLSRQPDPVRRFLLETSVLDRLCGSLCDAVTGGRESSELLRQLDSSNLFIISLDNRREWYRYHHLFADLLKQRLLSSESRDRIAEFYRRAGSWHEGAGFIPEAVSYAIRSQDWNFASDMIERHVWNIFYRSETELVYTWLRALPEACIKERPILAAVYANCLLLAYRDRIHIPETYNMILGWLNAAESSVPSEADHGDNSRYKHLKHYINKIRIFLAIYRGVPPAEILSLSRKALEELPDDEMLFRSAIAHCIGYSHMMLDEDWSAIAAFDQVCLVGERSLDLFNTSSAIGHKAEILLRLGRLKEAASVCDDGLQLISRLTGGRMVPFAGMIDIILGKIWAELGEYEKASAMIQNGISSVGPSITRQYQQMGYIELASISQILGKTEDAMEYLDLAAKAGTGLQDEISANRARLRLLAAEGDPRYRAWTRQWLSGQNTDFSTAGRRYDEAWLTKIRVMIDICRTDHSGALRDLAEAASYLEMLLEAEASRERPLRQAEILLLMARMNETDNPEKALAFLEEALEIGERCEARKVFAIEGKWMVKWLQMARAKRIRPAFCDSLLDSLLPLYHAGDLPGGDPDRGADTVHKSRIPLAEPLSDRETEVLRLISSGASNRDIASNLFISINTVKTHINHIFGKLGADSRTQAVAKAVELGLISRD